MRIASAIPAAAILALAAGGFARTASAAPGDAWVVTGNQVNVRSEPSTDGRIWARVDRDEPAVELAREGEWIRVELPGRGSRGWIHGSLLAAADPANPPEPIGGSATMPETQAPETQAPETQAEAPAAATPTAPASGSDNASDAPATPAKPDANTGMAAMPAEGDSATTPGETTAGDGGSAVATVTPEVEAAPSVPETSTTEMTATEPPRTDQPVTEAPGTDQPTTEPPTSVAALPDPIALERFRTSVDYLNDRALAAAGIDLFERVEQTAAGTAQVVVTDAWSLMPPSGRQSYLNILYDRWLAATGARGPLSVQIIDPSGKVADQKSGP